MDILSTDYLKKVYKEVDEIGPKLEIEIQIVPKVDKRNSGGKCSLEWKNNLPCINILIRSDMVNEETISHELYHGLFIKKGFGLTRAVESKIPFQYIAEYLHTIIEHTIIYDIQKENGLTLEETREKKSKKIFNDDKSEIRYVNHSIVINALLLVETMLGTVGIEKYEKNYIENIQVNFPKTYELANRIYLKITESKITDAVKFRKVFIECLKLSDQFLRENMNYYNTKDSLTNNIAIGCVIKKGEELKNVNQIFIFEERDCQIFIKSKKDNVLCYIIKSGSDLKAIKKLSVEELIGVIDGIVSYC